MKILWKPNNSYIRKTNLYRFQKYIENKIEKKFNNYDSFWRWSIDNKGIFWQELSVFFDLNIKKQKNFKSFQINKSFIKSSFFINSKVNYFSEINKIRNNSLAIKFYSEDNFSTKISYSELHSMVNSIVIYFKEIGLKKGDRVVGYLPNIPDSVLCLLACSKLGIVWSSCSPDFGVKAVIDRFKQLKPKLMIIADYYVYNGKKFNYSNQLDEIQKTLRIPNILKTSYPSKKQKTLDLQKIYLKNKNKKNIDTVFLPFDYPLYVLFSSGTTGLPKCITHTHGGVILQHIKELSLHSNITKKDNMLFYTTCGWMMWNWMISNLLLGASITLYEGALFYPTAKKFIDVAKKSKATVLGAGAKVYESLQYSNLKKEITCLKNIKSILSTGSPLADETFEFINKKINNKVPIHSISGGTDIVSCFMLGNPTTPVYIGEIQCPGLGMDIDVFNDRGVSTLKTGELVCLSPFPSKPIYFWNDKNNKKFKNAYFKKFKNTWSHGDFVKKTKYGGYRIYGRSDAILNPGGVRIGTAEIYNVLKSFKIIQDALAVGFSTNNDEKIVLFLKLQIKKKLSDTVIFKIRTFLKKQLSPRHVPWKIFQIQDIPRTKSGKNSEIIVKKILNNDKILNTDALANPKSLDEYRKIKING